MSIELSTYEAMGGTYTEVKYSLQGTTRRPRNGGC